MLSGIVVIVLIAQIAVYKVNGRKVSTFYGSHKGNKLLRVKLVVWIYQKRKF